MEKTRTVHALWLGAVLVAQERGDLSQLIKLLRSSEMQIRQDERELLAELLSRRVRIVGTPAAKKGGRPRPKLFAMTAERRLKRAADFARRIMRDYQLPKDMSVAEYLSWCKKQPAPKTNMTADECLHWQEGLLVKDGRKPTQAEAIQWVLIVWPDEAEWLSSKDEPGGKLANYLAGRRGASRRHRRRL